MTAPVGSGTSFAVPPPTRNVTEAGEESFSSTSMSVHSDIWSVLGE